jgi:hypothetical protein
MMIHRTINMNHTDTFTLIEPEHHDAWWRRFHDYYEHEEDPTLDRDIKGYSVLHATFQTLSNAGRLRVTRGVDFHRVDILDHGSQVILAIECHIGEKDAELRKTLVQKELTALLIRRDDNSKLESDSYLVELALVLPIVLPDLQEFRDIDGKSLELYHADHDNNYYPIYITIDKRYIKDV